MKRFLLILVLFVSFSAFAEEEVTPIGHFSAWRAYKGVQNGQTTCYMAATPLRSSQKREDAYLMIARHKEAKKYNEIVVYLGAPYHKNSQPTIGVDNQKAVALVPSGDKAWVKSTTDESNLISKMIEGNIVRVTGKSARGTVLKDSYSLKGFTKALEAVTKECP